jgi:hypothetical protein
MAHDVYLGYDEDDLETALNVCETLEDNGLKCWMKNRDVDEDNRVRAITKAIKASKLYILIHSKNSKSSKFINNEVSEAFDSDRSFLVYYIDDSKLEGGLEYFLKAKPSVKAYPNPEEKNDVLIKLAKNLVKKRKREDSKITNVIKNNKKAVAIAAIALVAIVAVVGFMMYSGVGTTPSEPVNVGDYKLKITDFNMEDVTKQDLGWNYSYSVVGTISPTPSGNSSLKIVVDFYDQSGKLIQTTETPFEDAQISGSGYLFGSFGYENKDITYAEVQLIDSGNVIIAQDDAQR